MKWKTYAYSSWGYILYIDVRRRTKLRMWLTHRKTTCAGLYHPLATSIAMRDSAYAMSTNPEKCQFVLH